jgi:hypothetical protein
MTLRAVQCPEGATTVSYLIVKTVVAGIGRVVRSVSVLEAAIVAPSSSMPCIRVRTALSQLVAWPTSIAAVWRVRHSLRCQFHQVSRPSCRLGAASGYNYHDHHLSSYVTQSTQPSRLPCHGHRANHRGKLLHCGSSCRLCLPRGVGSYGQSSTSLYVLMPSFARSRPNLSMFD